MKKTLGDPNWKERSQIVPVCRFHGSIQSVAERVPQGTIVTDKWFHESFRIKKSVAFLNIPKMISLRKNI